jgi:hypothetical protein
MLAVVVWCVCSCVEPAELVDCAGWGSFDRGFGDNEGHRVGYTGFGQVGNTFLHGESLVFLCLLDVEFGWRSLLSFLEVRLFSSLTLSSRLVDILEFGRQRDFVVVVLARLLLIYTTNYI